MKFLLAGLLLAFTYSWSQGCCGATGARGFAKVGPFQQKIINTRLSFAPISGNYGGDGTLYHNSYSRFNNELLVGAGTKIINNDIQVNASLPITYHTITRTDQYEAVTLGLGDAIIGAGYSVIKDMSLGIEFDDAETFIPYFDVGFGVKIPTGISKKDSKTDFVQDGTTSDGLYGYNLGLDFSKLLTVKQSISLSYSYWYFMDGFQSTDLKKPEYSWNLGYVYSFNIETSGSIGFSRNVLTEERSYQWNLSVFHTIISSFLELNATVTGYSPKWLGLKNEDVPEASLNIGVGARMMFK